MNAFWIALQFLTILPTVKISNYNDDDLGKSILFYPLVGLIIGLLLWLTQHAFFLILNDTPYTPQLVAALILTLWTILTGGLHLDGLADSADAWIGGIGDKEKTLQIFKDPSSGPIAVVTLTLTLLLKWLSLLILLSQESKLWIIIIPTLSRASLFAFFLYLPYVRKQGIASIMIQTFPRTKGFQIMLALSLIAITAREEFFVCLITLSLFFCAYRHALLSRLNGFTGDTLGAWLELAELAMLLSLISVI